MAGDQKTLTYRVRRLPPDIDKPGVVELLQQNLATEDCVPTIRVFSLAKSLDSPDTPQAKVATATFSALPSLFQGKEEWSLTALYHDLEYHIVIDRQFLDFTVLSEVPDDEHTLDCVAISGLGSHPFGSWQQRGNPDFMWLRDGLPKDLHGVRTIIYGYDTHLTESKSFKSTYDIALALANRLTNVGFGWPAAKPIVFLCHSLGGIIFKEAVVILASSSGREPSLLEKLRAALFFGVPNAGMETTQLRTMVKGDPTEQLIEDLTPRSRRLSSLDSLFSGHQAARGFRVVSFYETETTRTVVLSSGRWTRDGPEVVMVEKDSAIQKCSRHPDEVHSIDKDHSAMVKFSHDDVSYNQVLHALRKVPNQDGAFSLGIRRRTTGISLSSEESGGQHEDGEVPMSTSQQTVRANRSKEGSKEILESLRLDVFDRRLNNVSAQYHSTFEWMFSDDSLQFVSWLLKGGGTYWIEGKPGAGKSTLMKYIYKDRRTAESLHQWAGAGKLIQASFFFHHRGETAQKSFDGLLRSILYQILQDTPELCRRIPQSALPKRNKWSRYTWDLACLRRTFSWILGQQEFELYICLFIDALDEFDGHLELISDFMAGLIGTEQAVHCKICFSNRPREIIRNNFGQFPNFRIQDYTTRDIRMYTEGRLVESSDLEEALCASREERDKVDRVADRIISQADGVFLWVRLALDDIIKALSQRQNVSADDLEMLLQNIPPELEAFYESITQRIPHEFRWETYLALDVILRADERLALNGLHTIIVCWSCKTLQECYETNQLLLADQSSDSGPPRKQKDISSFVQKLKDNCGGLIEVDEHNERIHLMHETVRAFLSKSTFRQLILGKVAIYRPQNGYTELAKFGLTRVQYFEPDYEGLHQSSEDIETRNFGRLVVETARYCFLAESTTGACQYEMIESFNPVEPQMKLRQRALIPFLTPGASGIHFAVASTLLIYMNRKLQATEGSSLVDSNAEYSLFQCLCDAVTDRVWQAYGSPMDLARQFDYGPMAGLLLEKGADKRAPMHGVTPFEWLLTRDIRPRIYPHPYGYLPRSILLEEPIVSVVQALLDAEEDPNFGLFEKNKNPKGKHSWTPLHVSMGSMAQLLLEKNANVNAKGPWGTTPLDVAMRTYAKDYPKKRFDLQAVESTLDLFIRYGGLISSIGLKYLPMCVSQMERKGFDVQKMKELPQRSKELGYLSTKGSISSYAILGTHLLESLSKLIDSLNG